MRPRRRSRRLVLTGVALLGVLVLLAPRPVAAVPGETKFHADDPDQFASFGDAVAISGDLCVVGAPAHIHGEGPERTGAVYAFEPEDGWVQRELRPPVPQNLQNFGWAVECDTELGPFGMILVGAYGDSVAANGGGAVYVYERGSGGWSRVQTLTPSDPREGAHFGNALQLDGDTLVVGAPSDREVTTSLGPAGAAYVFRYVGGSWVEEAKLLPSGEFPLDAGWSVSIDGDRVAVGAPSTASNSSLEGAVFMYARSGGSWSPDGVIQTFANDSGRLGWAVGVSGDHVIASAHFANGGNGEVYSYWRGTGGWEFGGELPRTTPGQRRSWGSAIAMDGTRALVGANADGLDNPGAGAVYAFERTGPTTWEDRGRLASEDARENQYYGVAVDFDATGTIVGAPNDDEQVRGAGAAYFFPTQGEPPVPVIRSFLLPQVLDVNTNVGRKSKPAVRSSGIFDTGPDEMDFTAAAQIQIGPTTLDVPGLERKRGRKERYGYDGQGLSLTVTPSRYGTSKARYALTYTGTFPEPVDANGEFTLRYTGSVADAEGSVQLADGKFRFAGKAGRLLAPELDIRKAKAKLPGVGRHQFKFVAGFTTEGADPPTAPACRVQFGAIFSADLPSASFDRRRNGDWVLGEKVGGVTNTIMSFKKERITVKAKQIDLGSVPDGPAPLLLVLSLGDDERAVEVRAVRKGKIFKY